MLATNKHKKIILFLIISVLALALVSCGGSSEQTADETLVITEVPPTPTATPLPTRDVILVRPTMTPIPMGDNPAPVITGAETNSSLSVETVNTWLKWYPPSGWVSVIGPDGAYISPDPSNPNSQFAIVRKWQAPVPVDGWQNYLPHAEIEPNGHVQLLMAGRTWDGIFVDCPDFSCRAMFAVTKSGSEHLSLLVYVPAGVDITTSGSTTQDALYQLWDSEAEKLNGTLQTLVIN